MMARIQGVVTLVLNRNRASQVNKPLLLLVGKTWERKQHHALASFIFNGGNKLSCLAGAQLQRSSFMARVGWVGSWGSNSDSGPECNIWTKSQAKFNIHGNNLPPDKTLNLFIWSQIWNKQSAILTYSINNFILHTSKNETSNV